MYMNTQESRVGHCKDCTILRDEQRRKRKEKNTRKQCQDMYWLIKISKYKGEPKSVSMNNTTSNTLSLLQNRRRANDTTTL